MSCTARSATRRSAGVSACRPLTAIRRGRAPASRSSPAAVAASAVAPQRSARAMPDRRCSVAALRCPERRSSAPRSTSARACSSRASDEPSSATASSSSATPSAAPSTIPSARRVVPRCGAAPNSRARSTASRARSRAASTAPSCKLHEGRGRAPGHRVASQPRPLLPVPAAEELAERCLRVALGRKQRRAHLADDLVDHDLEHRRIAVERVHGCARAFEVAAFQAHRCEDRRRDRVRHAPRGDDRQGAVGVGLRGLKLTAPQRQQRTRGADPRRGEGRSVRARVGDARVEMVLRAAQVAGEDEREHGARSRSPTRSRRRAA